MWTTNNNKKKARYTKVAPRDKRGTSVASLLCDLRVGDTLAFPAEEAASLSTQASRIGFTHGRRYRTRRNTESRLYEVTRTE